MVKMLLVMYGAYSLTQSTKTTRWNAVGVGSWNCVIEIVFPFLILTSDPSQKRTRLGSRLVSRTRLPKIVMLCWSLELFPGYIKPNIK